MGEQLYLVGLEVRRLLRIWLPGRIFNDSPPAPGQEETSTFSLSETDASEKGNYFCVLKLKFIFKFYNTAELKVILAILQHIISN